MRRSRLVLDRGKAAVGDVAVEHPGHAGADLLGVRVDAVAGHMRHRAPVPVEAAAGRDGPDLGALLKHNAARCSRERVPKGW